MYLVQCKAEMLQDEKQARDRVSKQLRLRQLDEITDEECQETKDCVAFGAILKESKRATTSASKEKYEKKISDPTF